MVFQVSKPYARLDSLLERRLKQVELEQRQKVAIQQVIAKYKLQERERRRHLDKSHNTSSSKEEVDVITDKTKSETSSRTDTPVERDGMEEEDGPHAKKQKLNGEAGDKEKDLEETESQGKDESAMECEEEEGKEEKENGEEPGGEEETATERGKAEDSRGKKLVNGDIAAEDGSSKESSDHCEDTEESGVSLPVKCPYLCYSYSCCRPDVKAPRTCYTLTCRQRKQPPAKPSSSNKREESQSNDVKGKEKKGKDSESAKSAAAVAKSTTTLPALTNTVVGQTIAALIQGGKIQLTAATVADLEVKLSHVGYTQYKVTLFKSQRGGRASKGKVMRKNMLPSCIKFQKNKCPSIFLLEKTELRKLARKQGKCEASGFNYNCKMNNVNWPYPCPRPLFKTAWRYRTQLLKSLAAAALQLRIAWACIRWDDMNVKPPAGGTNTVTTDTDITTTELLKRRDVGPYNLRSEFLVRKIVVPIGVPQATKSKWSVQAMHELWFHRLQ